MAGASSRNALDGRSIQRVTLYDGGGAPITTLTVGGAFTSTKTALTAMSPAAVVTTAASAQAVGSQGTRQGLTLINTDASSGVISLAIGVPAVLYSGITLYPYGSFSMDDYSFSTGPVNAIASASGARLSVQQWTS